MTTAYIWKINQLQIATSKDGLNNVVQNVFWTLSATDEEVSVETVAETFLQDADPNEFVQFELLDEATVLSWVQQSLGQELIESFKANLLILLEEKKSSTVKLVTPPWKGA